MKFVIITPTHYRAEKIKHAINSVLNQTYLEWEMIIINDSPQEDYSSIENLIERDLRFIYIKNEKNIGKNASINKALTYLKERNFDGYIIFLDDDDWLSQGCLSLFASTIKQNNFPLWTVSKRTLTDGNDLTKNNTGKNTISYYKDYLILKKMRGDVTHCINFSLAKKSFFSRTIKNGEEWLFFSQIADIYPNFLYIDHTGTFSFGYEETGLNFRHRSKKDKIYDTIKLFKEKRFSPPSFIYLCIRFTSIILKIK